MCGLEVQANQMRPIGRTIAPMIIGGKRSSGMTWPCLAIARVKFVRVE